MQRSLDAARRGRYGHHWTRDIQAHAAYQLSIARLDLRVPMIDVRGICIGATGRNDGHISHPAVHHLRQLAKKFGAKEAVQIRQLSQRNET